MQALKANRPAVTPNPINKYFSFAIILIILVVVAIIINNAYRAFQPAPLPQGVVPISQSVLEEKYGLHVNLVAVTGAGGFVDLRLKILDGAKAKLLLGDKKNYPTIFTSDGITLNAPDDTKSQSIEYTAGNGVYIMYPNSSDAVKTGAPVQILFGDTALEPIVTK